MMVAAALFSAVRTDWCTPSHVLDRVRRIAPIGLDPCASADNPVGAACWLTEADDGLDGAHDWAALAGDGLVYANPPFGRGVLRWVQRCAHVGLCGGGIVVLLVPARTDTKWFHEAWESASAACLLAGRLTFVGAESPAPFPTALFLFGPRWGAFCDAFADAGIVQVLR